MLPKENRLTKKKDFEEVFKRGSGFREDFLFLKVLERDTEEIRFGFIVSQKISKKATLRNKIKRRLREVARLKLKEIKGGVDGIFMALPGLEEKDFFETKETIDRLFKKAKILKKQ